MRMGRPSNAYVAKLRRKYLKKKRKVRALRRKAYAPKWFSETFQASPLTIDYDGITGASAGQFHTASINSMPVAQWTAYSTLYRKYRIRKLEWIMIPRFAQAEPNQGEYNVGSGGVGDDNVVMHFRKSWAGDTQKPTSEINMLQNNGVKTLRLSGGKPIRITQRNPTTIEQIAVVNSGGGSSTFAQQKNRWCSFDDAVFPEHGGLLTYTRTNSSGVLQSVGSTCAQIYCKIYFEVANPR